MSDRIYYSSEAEKQAKRERTVIVLIVLAIGFGLGAILSLLMSPDDGETNRRELTDYADSAFSQTLSTLNDTIANLQKKVDKLT